VLGDGAQEHDERRRAGDQACRGAHREQAAAIGAIVIVIVPVRVMVMMLRGSARTAAQHHHHHPDEISARGILAMGASAGLIPCPSALVVLLAAVAQNQLALGLVMIIAFSLGLAATLTGLGIAVVHATRLPVPGRLAAVLPTASAAAIVGVGLLLTFQAAGQLA